MDKINELSVEGLKLINDLIKTNSLKKTADNLHISASAASRLLIKLRDIFDDELFTRNGSRMLPTTVSLSIKDKVTGSLNLLDSINQRSEKFDPSTLRRTFRIAVHEAIFFVFFTSLYQKMVKFAPHVKLEFHGVELLTTERLKDAKLDFAIMPMSVSISNEIISLPVLDTSWKFLVRKDHPVLKKAVNGRISSEEFSNYEELRIAIDNVFWTPLELPDGVDDWIRRGDFVRQETVVWAPYTSSVLEIIKNSNLTMLIYDRFADKICEMDKELQSISINPLVGKVQLALRWHKNNDSDVASQWFRSTLVSALKEIPPSRPSRYSLSRFSS